MGIDTISVIWRLTAGEQHKLTGQPIHSFNGIHPRSILYVFSGSKGYGAVNGTDFDKKAYALGKTFLCHMVWRMKGINNITTVV